MLDDTAAEGNPPKAATLLVGTAHNTTLTANFPFGHGKFSRPESNLEGKRVLCFRIPHPAFSEHLVRDLGCDNHSLLVRGIFLVRVDVWQYVFRHSDRRILCL